MEQKNQTKNLNEDLKSGDFKNLYLLFGEERFLVNYYAKAFDKTGFDKDTFDSASSVQDIMMAALSLPFLAEKRLVYVRDSRLFAAGRKNDSEKMAEFLPKIPSETIMVFAESEVDRRGRMYKKTVELGRAVDCQPPSPQTLTKWITRLVKEKNKTMNPENTAQLIRTVGSNMTTISQEIEKLAAYSGNETEITKHDIEKICTQTLESRIFDLTKAMSNGRAAHALSLYRNMLILKESPLMILSMIIRQFRILLLVKAAQTKNIPRHQISKELKLHEFVVSEALDQTRRFTEEKLLQALTDCQDTDIKIKTGLIAPEIGVELLIIKYGQ